MKNFKHTILMIASKVIDERKYNMEDDIYFLKIVFITDPDIIQFLRQKICNRNRFKSNKGFCD